MKTIVYIDGWNLYYRVRNAPYKWLNLKKLVQFYLPKKHNVIKIKYFTARTQSLPEDPLKDTRQDIYLRAIKTIPHLEVIFGQFKKRQITGLRCHYKNGRYVEGTELITISKWEEKETDVNIATHILADTPQYDCAVLISNDTDLRAPLKHIKKILRKNVGIISPRRNIHIELRNASHFQKRISNQILERCQFPEIMRDIKGEFFCPPKWKQIKG